jgi:glycosyltransferase involved in cell wall biosynthesis
MEFLFVDDCSPDKSVRVIDRTLEDFPERKRQTRIIKMAKNSGQAAVRSRGITESTGEFIIHCDGDDWVDKGLYEKMYSEAIRSKADVVMCDELWEYGNHTDIHECNNLPENCKEAVKGWYHQITGMFCHNKLVRRNIYKDNGLLPWNGLNMWEDNGLMTRVMYYGGTLSHIDGQYYHYNKENTSAMTSAYGEKQVAQMIAIAEHLNRFFQTKPDAAEFQKTAMAFQFLAKINLITYTWKGLKQYKHTFPGSERIISELDIKAFSPKGKIRFWFVRLHLTWLFILIYKCIRGISSFKKGVSLVC